MSLDYHFKVEQESGSSTYAFFGFNGTAGVWRMAALDGAGGWQDRTTVEDMDLAVRATLKGWKFLYLGSIKVKNELPSTFKAYRYQQHRWSCGPANLFRKMVLEIIRNKKVTLWKKLYVIYSFFFVRKIVAHIVTFILYCVVLPMAMMVPEVAIPKWGVVLIPIIITLLNSVGTPRSFYLVVIWILFENVMSLHRTKATFIGLFETGRVNEWVVTEKLGNASKGTSKPLITHRFKFGERLLFLELSVGVFLLICGTLDFVFGQYRKKTTTDTGTCSALGFDGILNDATLRVDAAIKVVSPSVVEETIAMECPVVNTPGVVPNPPPPTQEANAPAGNALGRPFYAIATGKPNGKKVNACTLYTPRGNGIDVVAYPVVANYVRNTWGKYGLVRLMFISSTRLFSFDFSSINGLDAMLENSIWFIQNNLLILKKWHPDENLLKEDVSTVPVWVKLHGVPVTAFNEDGLSAIATKLGTPLMLDSNTSDMCIQSWGRSSYARVMIKLRADVELKDKIVMAMPKTTREGHYTCVDEKKTVKKPTQTSRGVSVSNLNPFDVLNLVDNDDEFGTNEETTNLVNNGATSSGSSFMNIDNDGEFVSHTPIGEKIDKIERQICEGKLRLLDNDKNPLVPTGIMESVSEVEVVFDETANLRISTSGKDGTDKGFGTNSLLEQLRDCYPDNDDYDPYDDDMYENHDLSEHLQSICDDFDITYYTSHSVSLTMSEEDQAVGTTVLPKFDMPSYESTMTAKDIKSLALRHRIPLDLHLVALTEGWTMDKLSNNMIGLYEQRAIPDAMDWRHHDSDVNEPVSKDGFSAFDVQMLTEQVIDLRPVPSGLLFQEGLATTWDSPGFRPVFTDTEGNVVTMFEYLRFLFLYRASISKGPAFTSQDQIEHHTTRPFSSNQNISEKTDHQKRVKVEDPKIVATRERRARAAAKKREKRRQGGDGGEGSRPATKRRKNVARKDGPDTSEATSSPEPLWIINPTNPSGAVAEIAESREDRSPRISPLFCPIATQSASPPPSIQRGNVDEGESSRGRALYVPDWSIYQRFRLDTPMWCRKLMVHLALPANQEESNAINNATALERAWFSLARGALAQTDILARFECFQADFDRLTDTHSECGETVGKLVQDSLDLAHSYNLYTTLDHRYKAMKGKHEGCAGKLKVLKNRNSEPSQVNKDQALWIKELEGELAKKDFAFVYAERISAERAQEKEMLVTQLTIQAGWGKGLTEERSEEDLTELISRMENFDAYADKKMYVKQDPPTKPSSEKVPPTSAPDKP
nr:glucomannan 4-beta-mannosyltransferase 9-like [Tanacetum cinerariifolium]